MNVITVQITPEDIAAGVRFSPTSCPVARALRRASGGAWSVSGFAASLEGRVVVLPKKAQAWIAAFDNRTPKLEPFTFTFGFAP